MIIPFESLEPETLTHIIEDWLSRQTQECAVDIEAHDGVVQQVRQALSQGLLVVTWDQELQTLNILDSKQVNES